MPLMPNCRRCRHIRLVILIVVLGGLAGFAAIRLGGSRELSMAATFLGALLPLLWWARKNRDRDGDGV
ncbi:MAG: hypothetical protein KDJ39_03990 [Gammaproteobacteria bacterium]|nr:hypothetical protein [Gammaproteobacteria bacterium]MCP5298671.1 hypothetical protein [Chromatiaceae bacterium]